MAQYYDYILGLIPLALGGITWSSSSCGSASRSPSLSRSRRPSRWHSSVTGLFVRSPGSTHSQPAPQPNGGSLNSAE